MDLIVRPEAEADLAHAADWYREHGAAVKIKFMSRVEAMLDRIASGPSQFPHAAKDFGERQFTAFPIGFIS